MAITHTIASLEQAALQLGPDARLKLTRTLVDSLSKLSATETEQLWFDEAQQRDADMETGRVTGIPAAEVFQRLRSRFK